MSFYTKSAYQKVILLKTVIKNLFTQQLVIRKSSKLSIKKPFTKNLFIRKSFCSKLIIFKSFYPKYAHQKGLPLKTDYMKVLLPKICSLESPAQN